MRILGFTDQMSDWMAAADAMVHSTAGLTVLEAHIRGCPVVSYGFSAGHLRANNAAFERFGLAEVARSEHELESILRHLTRERRSPDSSFASLPPIASRVLDSAAAGQASSRSGGCGPSASPTAVGDGRGRGGADHRHRPRARLGNALPRAAKAAKPIESRVHFGKDEDPTAQQPPLAGGDLAGVARAAEEARRAGPLIGRLARGAALLRRRRRSTPGPALAPVVPPLGRALGIRMRQDGADGVALTFDDGPHPQGTPAVLEVAARGGRAGDLLPRRRAGRAAPGAGGGDRRRRPPGRAALLPPPQPAAADSAAADRRRRTGRAAIEEATGQAIADYRPPYGIFSAAGLRAIRRRGWRPVLWSLWGRDWTRRERESRRARSAPAGDVALTSDS